MIKTLYLVRHGESEGNINKGKYKEKHDSQIELTENGVIQATDAGARIHALYKKKNNSDIGWFQCISSTYVRAKHTRDVIAEFLSSLNHKLFHNRTDPRLREREWGELRDIIDDKSVKDKDPYFNFYFKPKDGESYANCYDRVACFHQWLLSHSKEEDVIIVAHGELIKCYLAYLFGWTEDQFDWCKNPKNCEVFMVDCVHDGTYNLNVDTPITKSNHYKGI